MTSPGLESLPLKRKMQTIPTSDSEESGDEDEDEIKYTAYGSKLRLIEYDSADGDLSKDSCQRELHATEPHVDEYNSVAKRVHRAEFAINCEAVPRSKAPNRDVLYLETHAGETTKELLNHGFAEKDLHPCNLMRDELDALLVKYPGVVVEHDNIFNVFKRQFWLGAWFDLETSLLLVNRPDQPWDFERVPDFCRATVVAMSLSSRRVRGTAEQFAVELQCLMQDRHGFITSPQMARAYSGRSDKQNMVFALSIYEVPRWSAKDYLFQHVHIPLDFYGEFEHRENYMQVDGHLVAAVSRVSASGRLHLRFQSRMGWFFTNDDPEPPVPVDVVQGWLDKWNVRTCAKSPLR